MLKRKVCFYNKELIIIMKNVKKKKEFKYIYNVKKKLAWDVLK